MEADTTYEQKQLVCDANANSIEETASKKPLVKFAFGNKNDHLATPAPLLKAIHGIFNEGKEMFDPCPLRCTEFDGLDIPWKECNFVNPPFSGIKHFLKKAIQELETHDRESVFLITVRTSTKYWRKTVFAHAKEIWFIQGNVSFLHDSSRGLPIPLCLVRFTKDAPTFGNESIKKTTVSKYTVIYVKLRD